MRNHLLQMLLLVSLLVITSLSWSSVTEYSFSSSVGTYSEISGGTLHGTSTNNDQVFNAISIGFSFAYPDTSHHYTTISISSNGFIALGSTVSSSFVPLSGGATNNVIVPFTRDLISRSDGSLTSFMSGTAPERVFTIQWKNYRRNISLAAGDTLNFQIKLYEESNDITFNYGYFKPANTGTNSITVQCGLRGAANTEFFNRATTTDWTNTTSGAANNSTCTITNTIFPPNGLIYNWGFPSIIEPSSAQIVSPLNNATEVALSATLNWRSGGGVVNGYKVYFGTDNPPTNIVNGTIQTATSFDPNPDMVFNSVYYWKIVPFNAAGDAVGNQIWSFTAMANPLVTEYPYTQTWDTVTAPNVPTSWTVVNANNDFNTSTPAVPYTWMSFNSSSYSAPNTMRCLSNSTTAIPMDDWLISPPLQLTAIQDVVYKIEFRYKAHSNAFTEKLEIKFGTTGTPDGLTQQIFNNASITNTGYVVGEAFVPPSPSGIYYFGFHGYSNANMYGIYIDDVTISRVVPVFNPPRNLTVITGNGTIRLSWLPPIIPTRRLDGYLVYRDNNLMTPNPITPTSFTDNLVTLNTLYTYNVVAAYVSPNGFSDPDSCLVTGTPDFNPPINLTFTSDINVVNLTWQSPNNFAPAGYLVYRNDTLLTTTMITNLTYADNSGVPGQFYSYYVTALYISPEGESGPSNIVDAASSSQAFPPTELSFTVSAPNVTLQWVAPTAIGLTGFKVYRDSVLIATINSATTTTYTDQNLLANTYSYTVSAVFLATESAQTEPVIVIVPAVFNPARNLTASEGDLTGVRVQWFRPSPILGNITGYRMYRDGSLLSPLLITDTTYFDTSIVSQRVYTYQVKTFYTNPNGSSVLSNSDTGYGGENLVPPYGLTYSTAINNVSLSWIPPGGPIIEDWINFDNSSNFGSLGFNQAANYDIAARFTQTELSGITSMYLTKVQFFAADDNCIYTAKVYTGGTALAIPGNLVDTVRVINPTIGAWNTVMLHAPIPIPSVGELRIAINCNAQAGVTPVGYDSGPGDPAKGNLIFINNAWGVMTDLDEDLTYDWNLQGFVTNHLNRDEPLRLSNVSFPTDYEEVDLRTIIAAKAKTPAQVEATRNDSRSLIGYKVYRNDVAIATLNHYNENGYTDQEVPNGTYEYKVTATYTTGESPACAPVTVVVWDPPLPTILTDGFENYSDFSLTIGNWTLFDVDNSPTMGIQDVTFPNSGGHMSFMVFNPNSTTPPMTNLSAHNGLKMAACFDATTTPNNDWMITPRMTLGTSTNKLSFWARSYSSTNGLDRFKLGITTIENPQPSSFMIFLSGNESVQVPTVWQKYTYDIPTPYNNQNVRFGIKCESDSASALFIDDFLVRGQVANEDDVIPLSVTTLLGNYPNPFNPETGISYFVKNDEHVTLEIYNLKGEKVRTLVNSKQKAGNHKISWQGEDQNGKKVSSGIYFYKMTAGNYSSTQKMMLMK